MCGCSGWTYKETKLSFTKMIIWLSQRVLPSLWHVQIHTIFNIWLGNSHPILIHRFCRPISKRRSYWVSVFAKSKLWSHQMFSSRYIITPLHKIVVSYNLINFDNRLDAKVSRWVFLYGPVCFLLGLNVVFFIHLLSNPNLMNCYKKRNSELRTNRTKNKTFLRKYRDE